MKTIHDISTIFPNLYTNEHEDWTSLEEKEGYSSGKSGERLQNSVATDNLMLVCND